MQKKDYQFFRKALLGWFAENQRDLPWRRVYDPYHVWIAEVMLQQTQMERGVAYFNRWMEQFPDIDTLASSSELSIMKAWEGLGYYTRARNVMKAARILVEEFQSRIPENYDQLLSLPGIGPYTVAAILSIAFNRPYPVIDANVERLFARLEDIDQPVKDKNVQQKIRTLVTELLPEKHIREFNQALMEAGALVCTPKIPDCVHCPLQLHCKAYQAGTVANRPVPRKKQEKIHINMACTIIIRENKIFIQQRRYDDVWGGLWEFPGGRIKQGESPSMTAIRELYEETEFEAVKVKPFETVTHFYTRYRVTLHSFMATIKNRKTEPKLNAALQYRWASIEELDMYPFPAGHRQLIEKLKNT